MTSPHEILNPKDLAPAVGFSHAVVAGPGRAIHIGGQTAHDAEGKVQGKTVVEQFEAAAANLIRVLDEAGAKPEHLVSMQIFCTKGDEYRASLKELGDVYKRHFGRHYPAISFFSVNSLFDPAASIEVVATAVIPE
ncbi:MAG: RidA family protein [Actinomycetota bacterium]|nr:RidA family protein [Actinomycetota bacterium]